MATVYLARTRVVDELYRNVALKLMHPHLRTEDGAWALQLVDEAKVAASIRHPNVVPVLEVGEDAHGVFLVMDYVEGDTLSGIIRAARATKKPVPAPIAARILGDALLGLHAAHELKNANGAPMDLVHRDFSPQNLLVGTDGVSRLTDFGIAKVTSRVNVTASGIIKGKVGYMAPEQALGRPLDRRCDVWAAGVVAWELLGMRRLYGDQDQVATLLRLVSQPPPRIRSVRSDVPQAVDDVIATALEVEPEKRCPTALEFKRRLTEAWSSIGPIADSAEVGEYVRQLVGAKLDKRRSQALSVLALRQKISHVSERAIEMASRDGFDSAMLRSAQILPPRSTLPSVGSGETTVLPSDGSSEESVHVEVTTEQSSNWSRSRPAPSWKRPVLGAVITLFAAVAIALFAMDRMKAVDPPVGTTAPRESDARVVEAVSSEASRAGNSEDASAPDAQVVRTALMVRSDLPMTGLKIGPRQVGLAAPTKEMELLLAEAERAASFELTATAQDGRRATAKVGATQRVVDLNFPAKTWSPQPPKTTSKQPPPGLAPTPYEQ
jgi:serine/threonine-protein kinase